MLTTTTTTTRPVESHTPYPAGTVVDIIGGSYDGHIGRVKRYTAQRVVINLYPALGRAGSKQTINKQVTIKKTNVKARKSEPEEDESPITPCNNIKATSDKECFIWLAKLVASQIKSTDSDRFFEQVDANRRHSNI
jgi:hypothetical protein